MCCLEELTKEDQIVTSCKHTFHKECLKKITLPQCPVCRRNIKEELLKLKPVSEKIILYYGSDDSDDDDRPSSPRNTGFFHRMIWG
jgi:hypothetical protein